MKKVLYLILMALLAAVLVYSLREIIGVTSEYQAGADSYEELEDFVVMPATRPTIPKHEEEAEEETTAEEPEILWPEVDFASLSAINDDVVGWIYVPGTNINYPIVQGSDNDYYLTHLFNGKKNSSGSIFLDYGAEGDFTSTNSVLHGHHMKNGSMFADVCDYKAQSFYEGHPTGMLLTPDGNYEIRFFSGYVCNTGEDAWNAYFAGDDYSSWLDRRIRKSYFYSPVVPTAQDRVITLSTCSYEYDDARFVLHGVLVSA